MELESDDLRKELDLATSKQNLIKPQTFTFNMSYHFSSLKHSKNKSSFSMFFHTSKAEGKNQKILKKYLWCH